jgi:pyruvate dehydrogenase E1 component alpha subunit/2-oxoisovalerate dehydrogenase E1 component alpha subunit
MVSHLGAMIAVVNGTLLGQRFKGVSGTVGVTSLGDGGTSTGAFHESINQAAVEKLPLVLVIANNQYAYSTPNSRQFACRNLVDKAAGYGVQAVGLDATDLAACLEVVGRALQRARNGQGPQLVVARLLRLCGHGEHDDANYIDPALKQSPLGRDCLKVAEEQMIGQDWIDAKTLEGWRAEAVARVEEAIATVQHEPAPDPYQETWCALVSKHLSEPYQDNDRSRTKAR